MKKINILIILTLLITSCGKDTETRIVTQTPVDRITLEEIELFCNEVHTRADKIERCIGQFVIKDIIKWKN